MQNFIKTFTSSNHTICLDTIHPSRLITSRRGVVSSRLIVSLGVQGGREHVCPQRFDGRLIQRVHAHQRVGHRPPHSQRALPGGQLPGAGSVDKRDRLRQGREGDLLTSPQLPTAL